LTLSDDKKTFAGLAAIDHLEAGLAFIAGDYMGEHWLATFAVLAIDERQVCLRAFGRFRASAFDPMWPPGSVGTERDKRQWLQSYPSRSINMIITGRI
jgi:hypothetical protein